MTSFIGAAALEATSPVDRAALGELARDLEQRAHQGAQFVTLVSGCSGPPPLAFNLPALHGFSLSPVLSRPRSRPVWKQSSRSRWSRVGRDLMCGVGQLPGVRRWTADAVALAPVALEEFEGINGSTCRLVHIRTTGGTDFVERHVSQDPVVHVKFAEKQPSDDLLVIASHLQDLVTVATGRRAALADIELRHPDIVREREGSRRSRCRSRSTPHGSSSRRGTSSA